MTLLPFIQAPKYPWKVIEFSPEPYPISLGEIHQQLVAPFDRSYTRLGIWTALNHFCHDVLLVLPSAKIWLNGSFVEWKENPADVDVTLFYQFADAKQQYSATTAWIDDFKSDIAQKSNSWIDLIEMLPVFAPEDIADPILSDYMVNSSDYSLGLFSRTRLRSASNKKNARAVSVPKGFLELQLVRGVHD